MECFNFLPFQRTLRLPAQPLALVWTCRSPYAEARFAADKNVHLSDALYTWVSPECEYALKTLKRLSPMLTLLFFISLPAAQNIIIFPVANAAISPALAASPLLPCTSSNVHSSSPNTFRASAPTTSSGVTRPVKPTSPGPPGKSGEESPAEKVFSWLRR